MVTRRLTTVASRSLPFGLRNRISALTPISSGPNDSLKVPSARICAIWRPLMETKKSPRLIPASEAGLSGKTCETRSSVAETCLELKPIPMNWLFEKKASVAAWEEMRLKL